MNITLHPHPLSGVIPAIPSKSAAHRLLLCAALADKPTTIACGAVSKDILATARCLAALGAEVTTENGIFQVKPGTPQGPCMLHCGESGSTLRFLLPVAAALGAEAEFHMEGRLPDRPLAPLDAQLKAHVVTLSRPSREVLRCTGRLRPGDYTLPGNVSSQYISGLLFALPLLEGSSTLTVTGNMESAPYVDMTLDALNQFGVQISENNQVFTVKPQKYQSPSAVNVEGDWSNAAFWLAAGVTVTGLDPHSKQGDRAVADLLKSLPGDIDASAIPDLVPILSVAAAAVPGTTRIYNAQRLRIKESDRLQTVFELLTNLGAAVEQTADGLLIHGGKPLTGGTVDSCNDHRIAMSAAIASTFCTGPVTILQAEAVEKSYPRFWEDFQSLQYP